MKMPFRLRVLLIMSAGLLGLAACSPGAVDAPLVTSPTRRATATAREAAGGEAASPTQGATATGEYEIVTLLPRDAIPSIDDPRFYDAPQADEEYAPEEMVLGVVFEGEARAYSVNMLSAHEIVNDVIQGRPIAVTW
jgi:hypothetical protein